MESVRCCSSRCCWCSRCSSPLPTASRDWLRRIAHRTGPHPDPPGRDPSRQHFGQPRPQPRPSPLRRRLRPHLTLGVPARRACRRWHLPRPLRRSPLGSGRLVRRRQRRPESTTSRWPTARASTTGRTSASGTSVAAYRRCTRPTSTRSPVRRTTSSCGRERGTCAAICRARRSWWRPACDGSPVSTGPCSSGVRQVLEHSEPEISDWSMRSYDLVAVLAAAGAVLLRRRRTALLPVVAPIVSTLLTVAAFLRRAVPVLLAAVAVEVGLRRLTPGRPSRPGADRGA